MLDGGKRAPKARVEALTRGDEILVYQSAYRKVVTGGEHQVIERSGPIEEAFDGRLACDVESLGCELNGVGRFELFARLPDPLADL